MRKDYIMEKANKDLIYEDVNMKMFEFPRVTKEDFMSQYEKYKDSPELALNLYIHMPDDSTEIIFNSQGHNKVEYIASSPLASSPTLAATRKPAFLTAAS